MKRSGLVLSVIAGCASLSAYAQLPQQSDQWFKEGQIALEQAKKVKPINGPAKNVILFVGDGMSVGTITAARIYAGQQQGLDGEEFKLSMESLPHTALAKTYNTDMQTPDSAGTATAMVSGVKTSSGVLGVNEKVKRGFCNNVEENKVKSAFQSAADNGLSVGLVTTTRITHATPAAAYAHSPDRDWENDSAISSYNKSNGCTDIAYQLVNFEHGDGVQVVFAGGRREFLPADVQDEQGFSGQRGDGKNLIEEWQQRYPNASYVFDRDGFDKLDNKSRVMGLFNPSHMEYELDRTQENKEPSIAEMTEKALSILENNKKGYVLMVEGGRIDHAHHAGNAARALEDTLAFDKAIQIALEKTNPKDTLVIVTADHAHSFVANGYAERGNDILGLSMSGGQPNKDASGKSYTTLIYGNGPGGIEGERPNVTAEQVVDPDYMQQALIKLSSETHSGEDVAIFARGPQAWLFQGVVEQNYIYHVIADALKLK
ncbi:alkaline phosphatase [Vibrio comitans]|uniref:Alkaline phosphatase n=1 Tax=Vibrio comitans NBRC 102076 TaxID=1219078 RepID=A0A4Y3IMU2_9VIBR|nr:alkaline phosphatase [Vibrio comitans]GEA60124.1 alkaline phosphatase [Vibrio comitans NBRC 102076]